MGIITLGIDPSTTCMGMVVMAENRTGPPVVLEARAVKPQGKLRGRARQSAIASEMIDALNTHRPDRVVIEGYGLNMQHPSSVIPLVELGGLLRYFLIQYDYSYLDPTPAEVKKFCAGKGNVKKNAIMMHVLKRWGFEAPNDDVADAYVLAAMGMAHAGALHGVTALMREVVDSLEWKNN